MSAEPADTVMRACARDSCKTWVRAARADLATTPRSYCSDDCALVDRATTWPVPASERLTVAPMAATAAVVQADGLDWLDVRRRAS